MIFCAVGSCLLGAADPEVNTVVDKGSMSTLNGLEEVELARLLYEMHPWANMVSGARNGGEPVTTYQLLFRVSRHRRVMVKLGPFQPMGKRHRPCLECCRSSVASSMRTAPQRYMWKSDSSGPT